jgi:hypothetical protein
VRSCLDIPKEAITPPAQNPADLAGLVGMVHTRISRIIGDRLPTDFAATVLLGVHPLVFFDTHAIELL